MQNVLSSDQFVAGVMAALTLKGRLDFKLNSTEIDEKFERAFERLVEKSDELGVIPSFSFERDQNHGDSASLRDTLLSAKERKIIALNNPTFWTFEIKLTEERAKRYLAKNPVPQEFYDGLADLFNT